MGRRRKRSSSASTTGTIGSGISSSGTPANSSPSSVESGGTVTAWSGSTTPHNRPQDLACLCRFRASHYWPPDVFRLSFGRILSPFRVHELHPLLVVLYRPIRQRDGARREACLPALAGQFHQIPRHNPVLAQ